MEITAKATSVSSTDNDHRKHFVVILSPDDLQLFVIVFFQKHYNTYIDHTMQYMQGTSSEKEGKILSRIHFADRDNPQE